VNVIGTKWGFKNKQGEDGEVVRNKAHLVAQGYIQVDGQDFGETFAPIARLEAIRILLAFAASKGFKLYQMDVKNAFLNSVIQEKVHIRQPPGFENLKFPNRVYKLSKALYRLKQAQREWYSRIKTFLLDHGNVMESVDKTLFTLKHGNDFLLVQIYMGDIIFGGSSHVLVSGFQEMMEKEFQMSMMRELTFFLGIQVKQMKQGAFIHQDKYTKDLMKKFNMSELKPVLTLMSTATELDPDENGETVNQREYRSMISSLLYLMVTQADIQFVVCLYACFQASPHFSHRTTVQRIFKYLKYTLEFGIWYSVSSSLDLVGFSDADVAGCVIDRKSTSGTYHFLGSSLVCWYAQKQSSIAQSTTESEYVVVAPILFG
jgi:hypothetical protein